jgi:nucleolar protein 56
MLFKERMKYLFLHVLGYLVLDSNLKLVEEVLFSEFKSYYNKAQLETKLRKKYPDLAPLPLDKAPKALEHFKDKRYFSEFYARNTLLTRKAVRNSVSENDMVTQAISNITELDRTCNLLVKRLREWYGLYLPELSQHIASNEKFVELIINQTKDELISKLKVEETMGAELKERDVLEMLQLAAQINSLSELRKAHEAYLEQIMGEFCPNLMELAGVTIGAKLLELGKGLKNLALLPASTIQLLGAEKALFRHIKTGARSPKYGVLINHPLVQNCRHEDKGKVARALADKLSMCARLDYFKGEFKAPGYRKELEKRFE